MKRPTTQKTLVLVGLSSIAISNGLIFGQTTGMINALKKKEDGISLSEGNLLFIASSVTLLASVGFAVATISDKIGRRWPLIMSSVAVIIHWVIIYKAQNMLHFTLSRIIAGIAFGTRYSLTIMSTSEYTSPKTRAFFLNIITTVSPGIGTLLGHYLGNIYHWRTIALIAICPALLGIILPYLSVESPHWLASKGRFEECEQSFRKLHRCNENAEEELRLLIKMEKCKLHLAEETNLKSVREKLFQAVKKRYFWNLMLLSFFMHAYIGACGKTPFTIFASVILEDITGNPNVLLYTMLVDVFFIIGSCMSCVLIRKMTIRNILFTTGYSANVILIILSACLYFGAGVEYLRWVNVSLLAVYFILIEAGPSPLVDALMGEIYPLEIKIYCFFIAGCMLASIVSLSIFLLPILSAATGYYGLFLLNALIMSLSLGFIWLSLPETKGRTLQEIEVYFKAKVFNVDDTLEGEQSNMIF